MAPTVLISTQLGKTGINIAPNHIFLTAKATDPSAADSLSLLYTWTVNGRDASRRRPNPNFDFQFDPTDPRRTSR